jgi:hypothetical protein
LLTLCTKQLEEIFGTSDTNSGTRDLTLTEFLLSLNASQSKQLKAKAAATAAAILPPRTKPPTGKQ